MPVSKATTISKALARFDAAYFKRPGVELLGGVDEAGRGALAGPVVTAAVVLEPGCYFDGLNDSKQIAPAKREELFAEIRSRAKACAIGWASAQEVDALNILQATFLAARRALGLLAHRPDFLLTDALKIPNIDIPYEPLVKGDARSQAIAAASILAKVTRDRWMLHLDKEYPLYGFASHKGYGCETHMTLLREHGSSTVHRHTFRGVDWFSLDYRPSKTAQLALAKNNSEITEEWWLSHGQLLPECEWEMLKQKGARA
jgi:ribonuclease HII